MRVGGETIIPMNTDEFILLDENDPLLTPEQMARAMNVSVGYLANLRSQKSCGPDYLKLGSARNAPIRYPRIQRVAESEAK